ncbi:hypothetical protein GUJ93_ZPchr0004g38935 [Zizania palustris]|uniref:Uncharacterized protein n=1 Tax=Zizania palustris TaxID=103762 RepID=A0A8J5S0S5_ZIZPA|nr:hypothetical protein GUJ93_ZPchr0004g38935 [Zizania palustris]
MAARSKYMGSMKRPTMQVTRKRRFQLSTMSSLGSRMRRGIHSRRRCTGSAEDDADAEAFAPARKKGSGGRRNCGGGRRVEAAGGRGGGGRRAEAAGGREAAACRGGGGGGGHSRAEEAAGKRRGET